MPMFDDGGSVDVLPRAPLTDETKSIIYRLGYPDKSDVRSALVELAREWIVERERVRQARLANQPPPWTMQRELNMFRFTNVRRYDDKVTQWLVQNWYRPYKDHPNLLLAAAIGRLINYIPTLQRLPWPEVWDPNVYRSALDVEGGKVFTSAYIITGTFGGRKSVQVVDIMLQEFVQTALPALRAIQHETWKLERAVSYLARFPGFSTFMAGQVLVDIAYLFPARDLFTWAPRGPGSQRWLRAWTGSNSELNEHNFLLALHDFRDTMLAFPEVREINDSLQLWAHDWQNICCELGKIYNYRVLGQAPRNRYRPGIG
jgi:hypothetical protein